MKKFCRYCGCKTAAEEEYSPQDLKKIVTHGRGSSNVLKSLTSKQILHVIEELKKMEKGELHLYDAGHIVQFILDTNHNVTPEIIREMTKIKELSSYDLNLLAEDEETPPDVFDWLAKTHPDPDLLWNIAHNPKVTPENYIQIAKSAISAKANSLMHAIAYGEPSLVHVEKIPPAVFRILAKGLAKPKDKEEWDILLFIAHNPSTPLDVLKWLSKSENKGLQKSLSENRSFTQESTLKNSSYFKYSNCGGDCGGNCGCDGNCEDKQGGCACKSASMKKVCGHCGHKTAIETAHPLDTHVLRNPEPEKIIKAVVKELEAEIKNIKRFIAEKHVPQDLGPTSDKNYKFFGVELNCNDASRIQAFSNKMRGLHLMLNKQVSDMQKGKC
jgi:hypothetical protein